MPEYFDRYINLVPDVPIITALNDGLYQIKHIDRVSIEKIGSKSYAKGKWTVNEIFKHIVDVERIFSYRALLIARNDKSITPGFDEKYMSDNSKANDQKLNEIIEELITTRQSTIALFKSFDEEVMLRKGLNWKYEMSVLAFGFCIAGHQLWHENIVRQKYFNL